MADTDAKVRNGLVSRLVEFVILFSETHRLELLDTLITDRLKSKETNKEAI